MGDSRKRPTTEQVLQHPFINLGTLMPEMRMHYHFSLSHAQADASGTASTLHLQLHKLFGVHCWLDMRQHDITLHRKLCTRHFTVPPAPCQNKTRATRVFVICNQNATGILTELNEALDDAIVLTRDADDAPNSDRVLGLLLPGIVEGRSLELWLEMMAIDERSSTEEHKQDRFVLIYSEPSGWDFDVVQSAPSQIQECVREHDAIPYRPSNGGSTQHEFTAMVDPNCWQAWSRQRRQRPHHFGVYHARRNRFAPAHTYQIVAKEGKNHQSVLFRQQNAKTLACATKCARECLHSCHAHDGTQCAPSVWRWVVRLADNGNGGGWWRLCRAWGNEAPLVC